MAIGGRVDAAASFCVGFAGDFLTDSPMTGDAASG
jgi:hypothetical protein